MKLNIGCGADKFGDIRIDIIQRHRQELTYKSKTMVNVIADAHFLPLRDKMCTETRCWHVLEHLLDPKLALLEMRRVTNGFINIKVPIWHLYSYIIETIALLVYFLLGRYKAINYQLKQILHWKKRYSKHKWYIKFKNAKINKLFKIPREYDIIFVAEETDFKIYEREHIEHAIYLKDYSRL